MAVTNAPAPDAATWTAIAALWARAVEQTTPQPLLEDATAAAWLEALSLDTSRFDHAVATQVAVCARARLIDRWVSRWAEDLKNHRSTVVELGVGFSTRSTRLSALNIDFVGLDRAHTAQQRAARPTADSIRIQIVDVTSHGWIEELQHSLVSRKPCFVAEGLLMYLLPREVEQLFARLAEAFPYAPLLFDAYAKPALFLQQLHDSLHQLNVPIRSTLTSSPHLRVVESHTLRDQPDAYARLPWVYRLPGVHRLHATHRAILIPPGSAR